MSGYLPGILNGGFVFRGPRHDGTSGSLLGTDGSGKLQFVPPADILEDHITNSNPHHQYALQSSLNSQLDGKADLIDGVIPSSQIPAIAISEFLGAVDDDAAMLELVGQRGDYCYRNDQQAAFWLTTDEPADVESWLQVSLPSVSVQSVNGQTGVVNLGSSDVGAAPASHSHTISQITDWASTIAGYAPLSGATFSGPVKLAAGNGFEVYNTSDVTNYERFSASWTSNLLSLLVEYGGSGVSRRLRIGAARTAGSANNVNQTQYAANPISSTVGSIHTSCAGNGAAGPMISNSTTLTAASGIQIGQYLETSVMQSGAASYLGYVFNVSETSTGSGSKVIADFQLGGSSLFAVEKSQVTSRLPVAVNNNSLERLIARFASNTAYFGTFYDTGGVARTTVIGTSTNANASSIATNTGRSIWFSPSPVSASRGLIDFALSSGASGPLISMGGVTCDGSSGVAVPFTINPVINQSGTAGYSAFLINPSESAVGSGVKTLLDVQIGGSSRFRVDRGGSVVLAEIAESAALPGGLFRSSTDSGLFWKDASGTVFKFNMTAV
ncbi:hypothetical protein SH668x_002920 [Planctomicrobium sp. SH668]|uniref:hypothetical protein n=1 Tax=Planctomicrobium sp. SH668 TaxID=3448126 RepID=UPI003F5BBF05